MKHIDGVVNVAVIGAMGSGKSSVIEAFNACGCGCVCLDDIGHDIIGVVDVKRKLAETFGEYILDGSGCIIRSRLAECAFDTAEHTAQLNAITHPEIFEEAQRALCAYAARPDVQVVVLEASAGEMTPEAFMWADAVVYVYAPFEVRLERAVDRGKQTREDILARMRIQPTDDMYRLIADIVIDNSGTTQELRDEVARVYASLISGFGKDR